MTNQRTRHKNIRLPNYDYATSGAYLITICTRERIHYFVEKYNKQIARQIWHDLPRRFPSIRLDAFTVVPNHVHAILWLAPTSTDHSTLGQIVRAYKSLVYHSYRRNLLAHDPLADTVTLWQKGFYESIIRTDEHLEQARFYVMTNYEKHILQGHFPPPDGHPTIG